ncbi:MAG: DUF559 domain-containing protein [Nocardioides sp.]
MSVQRLLIELGGVASRAQLLTSFSRGAIDAAVARAEVVVPVRGRYALPTVDEAVGVAHAQSAVLCLTSAALHHGWQVKQIPELPHVMVPRNRKVRDRSSAHFHYGDLLDEQVIDGVVTDVETTLDHCLRWLPYDEALAIADSALRAGVPPNTLRRVSMGASGPGARQVRKVVKAARVEAANPFESVLRALADQVPGLHVEPQVTIRGSRATVRPDLVDVDLRIVVEADSFEWHGTRAALRHDCRRYDLLVADGWIVLRFAWEDVMHDQEFVVAMLTAVTALAHARSRCSCAA